MHFINLPAHCRKEGSGIFFFCITLQNLKVPSDETQAMGFVEKSDGPECKCEGVSTLCPSPPFPPFSIPLSPTRSPAPVSDRLFFHSGPGGWGPLAYRSTLSAGGKGMWATPILWAVSKQPLCNLWLGEVVCGEGAVCLLSVALHKCVFQIRVGGHVWLHGYNDFPHTSTFGRRTLAFLYSVPRHAKSKHLSSAECFIPDFLSSSACLAIASL